MGEVKGYIAFTKEIFKNYEIKRNEVLEYKQEEGPNSYYRGFTLFKNPDFYLYNDSFFHPLVDGYGKVTEYFKVVASDDDILDFDTFHKDDISCRTKKLKIVQKIGFPELIQANINLAKDKIISKKDGAKITVTKDNAKILSNGCGTRISSSGHNAQIFSSGYSARICSSGYNVRIGVAFGSEIITSSGNDVMIGATGGYARISSSGDGAQISSTGVYDTISSSGWCAHINSSGIIASICSSGHDAKIVSTGDSAHISSSGNRAKITSTGQNCVICCAGAGSIVRAKKGSWITLSECEWKYVEAVDETISIPICIKTVCVDGEIIKEDTFYKLENGEFVEVEEEE